MMKRNKCNYLGSFVVVLLVVVEVRCDKCPGEGGKPSEFATRNGIHVIVDGKLYYGNGFNAYWMMYEATELESQGRVTETFKNAQANGLTIGRTWGFRDGKDYRPLQFEPGKYEEKTFKGLDFVVAEANKFGIKLILALVNNWDAYGGKKQYVEWAKSMGKQLTNNDDFYTDSDCKQIYKNHVKTILTRNNTITGVQYMNDPTIFAWELINEPRCDTDPSGHKLGTWITEMSTYIKSIDKNHLLTVGTEGFYSSSTTQKQCNPNNAQTGSDFISHHKPDTIDFATVHSYPDNWLPPGTSGPEQITFLKKWIQCHINDSQTVLNKPVLFTEFGNDEKKPGYTMELRREMYHTMYDAMYESAMESGAASAALFWQVLVDEQKHGFGDGTQIIFGENTDITAIISQQSNKLAQLKPVCKG